jgi:hypothetical protein
MRRKNKYQIKPKEVEQDEEHIARQTDKGTGTLTKTDLGLPTGNTKIPSKPASNDPVINSYMKGLAK